MRSWSECKLSAFHPLNALSKLSLSLSLSRSDPANSLKRRDILESLIKHVTEMPVEHLDEKERFKYANSSCVLFSGQAIDMESELLKHPDLLDRLLDFLNTDEELNPLMASFFANTLFSIYTKVNELMIPYLSGKPNFFDLLFKHIHISAIMDFLLKVFALEQIKTKQMPVVSQWLNSQNLIQRIVNVFKATDNQNAMENASHLLSFLIAKGRQSLSLEEEKSFHIANLFTRADPSNSEPFLTELVEICLSHRPSAIHILRVLVQFIDYENHFKIIENIKTKFNQMDAQTEPVLGIVGSAVGAVAYKYLASVKNLHRVMLSNLGRFKQLLVESVPDYTVQTTTGLISKPLGFVRLEIVHLFYALLQANNPELDEAFAKHRILEVLIDLFFEFEYNSFLHNYVNNIVAVIFLNANDSRFKLISDERKRADFLAVENLLQWQEKGLNYREVFNIVWSDRECLQHAKKLSEEMDDSPMAGDSTGISDELREKISGEVNKLIHESLVTCQPTPCKTKYTSLISQIFTECNLLKRLMEKLNTILSEKSSSPITKPVPTHKGNLVDIAKIINRFLSEFEAGGLPAQLLENVSFTVISEAWQAFAANELLLVDKKIIETEQSIKSQQTAEQDFRKYLIQAPIKPLDLVVPFSLTDYDFSVAPFDTHLDDDIRRNAPWEQEKFIMFKDLFKDKRNIETSQNFFKGIEIKDSQFDEYDLDRTDIPRLETPKLSAVYSAKETEEGEQTSSLNEKDNLFEPLASSSNISNELNIEMDCEYFWRLPVSGASNRSHPFGRTDAPVDES